MVQSYICNTPKNTIGRSAVSLNAKKCPNFQVADTIYLSNLDHIIHSRWVVTRISERLIEIVKNPGTSISIAQDAIFSKPYTEKYSRLTDEDASILDKHFMHQMKIFPSYNYESRNSETNKVLEDLKNLDPRLEVYPDSIYNDDILNGRLESPYSVLIIDNYGVITFKCIEEDPADGNRDLQSNFSNQLKCNDIYEMLSKSPQLTDGLSRLTINNINAIIYETNDTHSLELLNNALESNHSNVRVFNSEGFIKFIKDLPQDKIIIDEIKRIGVIQSLLPKFINSKTINITEEPLKFVPSDAFELDDIQKETLRSLDNNRTYIKASAGSGKTILLLAKAYEVAIANPKKDFLLLCYNNKLAEDIRNQAINTGRNASNLRISTFDKFLQDENIPFKSDDTTDVWSARKASFVELALNDKLSYSFGGIFVDEVQQMKDEWLCALLKCTDEEKYMIVSGDYYQSINPGLTDDGDDDDDFIEEGDTAEYEIGGYKFETIVLDKNYRNTKTIARVLDKMVALIHKAAQELEVSDKEEKVLGHAYKETVAPPLYIKTKSGQEEVRVVEKQIDELINSYDCAPSDILVICPQANSMTSKLVQDLWRKYDICNFTGRSNDKINTEGIKMGTIGKSIGLDFKAVILYGTSKLRDFLKKPCDYIEDIDQLKLQSKNAKRKYLSTLRNLYVACSRAREILIVLDDSESENLFTSFLKESGLEEK